MNSWKIIWNTFHTNSSRRSVLFEVWRLSSARQKLLIITSFAVFVTALLIYYFTNHNTLTLFAAVVSELLMLFLLEKIKDKIFFAENGHPDETMAPPDNDDHRTSRYMLFRKHLKEKNITKSHVEDIFPLVDMKLDLESSRGELPKKYFSFVIGLLAGIAVSLSKNLEMYELALAVISLIVVSYFVLQILWLIPSRTERLKELKYFMKLFCREI